MTKQSYVKVLPPRALSESETTHSLAQWKINFRQYIKRDDAYKVFLQSTTKWDGTKDDYGFVENLGERTPTQLADDVEDFLHLLASFLPHGYLTDKIVRSSKDFESAFKIVEEHYGLIPSQETFCDFMSIARLPNEPYRQFFDRMVAFLRKHLMSSSCKVEVDGTAVSEGGDGLTVTLLNLLTLEWIVKIHPDLLTIIRTEFSKELRDNVPLSSLVPRISLSIDALLMKYDKVPLAAKVDIEAHGQKEAMNVMKVKNSSYTNVTEKFDQKRSGKSKKRFCPGCFYMGNRSGAKMNFKHFPDECPRSTAIVAMLEAEEVEFEQGRTHFITNSTTDIVQKPPGQIRRVQDQPEPVLSTEN